jgi:predicted TIM-barrel fold metal-dependent hydrolase
MERLVKKYPNACFVTAHTTTEYADIMKRYPNLFVCSVPLLSPRACEEVVDAIGADRLLFGTDLLDLPIAWNLGPIIFARISAKEKSLILGENLKKILNEYSLPK